jgi:hypothetical protein
METIRVVEETELEIGGADAWSSAGSAKPMSVWGSFEMILDRQPMSRKLRHAS